MNCWLSPKGRTRDVKIDLPKGLPPSAQTRIDGLDRWFEWIVAPLPIEPVGLGAKWQVISRQSVSLSLGPSRFLITTTLSDVVTDLPDLARGRLPLPRGR